MLGYYPRTGVRIEGRLLSFSRFGAQRPALSVTQRQEMAIFLAKQDTGTTKRLVQPFCQQALALIRQKQFRSFRGLHPTHPQPTTRPVHDLPLAPLWPRPCAPSPQTLLYILFYYIIFYILFIILIFDTYYLLYITINYLLYYF